MRQEIGGGVVRSGNWMVIRPAGQTVPATVDRIEFQTVHPRPGQEKIKPVMYFVGKQKGLILTSTDQDFLRATFGDEVTASYGKPVTLRAVRKTIAGRGLDTIVIWPLLTTCTSLPLPPSPPTLEWKWTRDFPKVAQEYDFFNESNGGYHTGMDIEGSGDSVYAAAQGTVVALCPNGEVCLAFSTNADNHNMQGVVILKHTMQDGKVIYSLYSTPI